MSKTNFEEAVLSLEQDLVELKEMIEEAGGAEALDYEPTYREAFKEMAAVVQALSAGLGFLEDAALADRTRAAFADLENILKTLGE